MQSNKCICIEATAARRLAFQSRCISFSLKLWSQAGVASISTHWIPKGETRDAWNQCLDFLQPSLEKYENMIDIFATKSRWRFEAISRPFKNCMNYKLWIGNRLSLPYHTVSKPQFFVQKINFRKNFFNRTKIRFFESIWQNKNT